MMYVRLMLCLLLASFVGASPAFSSVELGKPAPTLKVTKLNGEHFDLAAEKGKSVIVIFFATWCDGCEKELQDFNSFLKTHRGSALDIIALSIDKSRDRKKVAELMQHFDFPGALLHDAETNDFGQPTVLPMGYAIDRSGLVRLWIKPSDTSIADGTLARLIK